MDKKEREKYDRKENFKFIGFLALIFLSLWLIGTGKLDFLFGNNNKLSTSEKLEIAESKIEEMENEKKDLYKEIDKSITTLNGFFLDGEDISYDAAWAAWDNANRLLYEYFKDY